MKENEMTDVTAAYLPRSKDCYTPWIEPCECWNCCDDATHPTDAFGWCNCGWVSPTPATTAPYPPD